MSLPCPNAAAAATRGHSIRPCAQRIRQRLDDVGGLRDFGVNLMRGPPGSSKKRKPPLRSGAPPALSIA
ncbi:hypothetical protein [Burkholderia cenocepacia]|uniref:hypothetical protein n=1 Tax=Burkholderia cenocepacia TaxID=95486 RepID=UPI0026B6BEC7